MLTVYIGTNALKRYKMITSSMAVTLTAKEKLTALYVQFIVLRNKAVAA